MIVSKRLVWASMSAMLLILSAQLASADEAKDKEKAAKERAEIDSNTAMIIKEFRELGRDRRTMAMLIVLPVLLLVVFAYAANFTVSSFRTYVVGPQRRR